MHLFAHLLTLTTQCKKTQDPAPRVTPPPSYPSTKPSMSRCVLGASHLILAIPAYSLPGASATATRGCQLVTWRANNDMIFSHPLVCHACIQALTHSLVIIPAAPPPWSAWTPTSSHCRTCGKRPPPQVSLSLFFFRCHSCGTMRTVLYLQVQERHPVQLLGNNG